MIDAASAKAFHHLSAVVGELLEDHAHQALTSANWDASILAADLHDLGEDIAVLATAMQILIRRGDWTSPP